MGLKRIEMSNYQKIKCSKCHTLVGVSETKPYLPYKTMETSECPVFGETICRHNSMADFEAEAVSVEGTTEPYKSKCLNL